MPSGQLMTMPVLIVNMGGEMVYILEQRLQAQKIPEPKGQKVLNDVVRTMYYPRFIEELFKPQEMYSVQSTRQIFDRLAHSSIMRLNESSMEKLFDLMAMGFKYQIISCRTPTEMVDITLNHLDALKRIVVGNEQLLELLEECVKQMHVAFGIMPIADVAYMRQNLCAFFQDRKVKVSLFLHDHTQNQDGSIVVQSSGVLPEGALPPGTVRYFDQNQEVRRDQLPAIGANAWSAGSQQQRTALGVNLYDKDRQSQEASTAAAPDMGGAGVARSVPMPHPEDPGRAAESGDMFKLESLFSGNIFDKAGPGKGVDVIEIDGTAPSNHQAGLDQVRRQLEGIPVAPADGTADDLLDLMDRAQ
eukprot:CAMPEP_0178455284 /NCGR_PEP_ID=MMETSP0689_2-20121128/45825_1 /TAXON_ID=160604 /ORGANISM="Amphidinium massartii, Strain CS-259" /LENGTH=358 /DNA_ID=CAMNT_0020081305 /DNA_START=90 /DNA_END=1166 /DNA_ORIENTATION=+